MNWSRTLSGDHKYHVSEFKHLNSQGHCGYGHMVVGFTTTYILYEKSAYHHYSCEFESCSWQGVLNTILCAKFCQ